MSTPPLFPIAPKEYNADQINQFARVLTQYLIQMANNITASSAVMPSNRIVSRTLVASDTSYVVVSYLILDSDFTINGNFMVLG